MINKHFIKLTSKFFRFARTNYEEDGRMLQNPCLTQCLNYVMYKDKKTRKKFMHQQLDNPVPKPLIVFIMVIASISSTYETEKVH